MFNLLIKKGGDDYPWQTPDYVPCTPPPGSRLYDELLRRYRQATTRLGELTKEANALQEENEWLRLANEDLTRRLHTLLSLSKSDHSTETSSSSLSLVDEGEERDCLPKNISVRSPGYFKQPLRPNATRLRVRGQEKAIEMEVYSQGMYKTELCNKWQETGDCPYGNHCQFAHGLPQLRPVIRHPRYKTQLCRLILGGNTCPYGHRCHFRHSLTPTPSAHTC